MLKGLEQRNDLKRTSQGTENQPVSRTGYPFEHIFFLSEGPNLNAFSYQSIHPKLKVLFFL